MTSTNAPAVKRRMYPHFFVYAALLGVVAGAFWGTGSLHLSRWTLYQSISLGMPQEQVVSLMDATGSAQTGCATLRWENTASVCRFEDAWRIYVVNFDPNTKIVNGKRFDFKFTLGQREPWFEER